MSSEPLLNQPGHFFNREVTHLQFHLRVLEQARMLHHPLLERLKFLLIFSNNLDEFFEIRVAGLKQRVRNGQGSVGGDQRSPADVLDELSTRCHSAIDQQYAILNQDLLPALAQQGIHFLRRSDWTPEQVHWARAYFRKQLLPVLSPVALDPAHPFPRIANKALSFVVTVEGRDAFGREGYLALVPAPRTLPRLIQVPAEHLADPTNHCYILLSSMIHAFAEDLFPGMTVHGCFQFRITRNAHLYLDEDEIDDLALALRGELYGRRFGAAVRLEVADNCPEEITTFLLDQFQLNNQDLYQVNGMVNLTRLFAITELDVPSLRYQPLQQKLTRLPAMAPNVFDALKQRDHLLHHPYESIDMVLELLEQAAIDPQVLAIKQTLYRVGKQSPILDALERAAHNGKAVTVVIELRARFDEEENLAHAHRLQQAGATVCYGVVGYKTHAKLLLILRRERGRIKRYTHLGTGNYHVGNTRQYTDFSLLTASDELGVDVNQTFQVLTGLGTSLRRRALVMAPFDLVTKLITLIDKEIEFSNSGKPSHIILKVNALTDVNIIVALYRASKAGVKIDLIVRGICCLKPQVPGLSESIRVISIVGRFLEHTRVYFFSNGNDPKVYLSSADLMERSLYHRVEVAFLVKDQAIAQRIRTEGLGVFLCDNVDAWHLKNDGDYLRVQAQHKARSAQGLTFERLTQNKKNEW